MIYALRNDSTLADSVLKNIASTGQKTRKIYQRSLPSDMTKDYYFIHRNTGSTEPIIVEYGFIDDTLSNVNFLNNNYKELAEAVIKAILEYKGISYIPPSGGVSGNTYTVKSGDTLYSIANKYNTTVSALKALNNLSSNTLSIGTVLKIPTSSQQESGNVYVVQPGDTLYKIAVLNNTTVDILKELNNLTGNTLSIGKELILPSTGIIEVPSSTVDYVVKKGDSLYSIAKNNNTTVNALEELNNLKSTVLSVGQVLKIPTTEVIEAPTTTVTYVVEPGDTLYSIARAYNTTVNNLKELNNLATTVLSVGQKLIISP